MHKRTTKDYAALLQYYDQLMDSFDWRDGLADLPAPTVSAWSAAQQIEHVAKVKQSIIGRLTRIAQDDSVNDEDKRPTFIGRVILFVGSIPRGGGKSPERFVAAPHSDVAKIKGVATAAHEDLRRLEESLPTVAASTGRFPHQYFGHLSGQQWVRFMRIHTLHHLKIVRDIRKHHATHAGKRNDAHA